MITKKVSHSQFKYRLFIGVGSIIIGIALIVSFLFSLTAIHNSKQTEISSSKIVLDRISMQVDSLYEQMNIAATSIIKNNELKQIVYSLNLLDSSEVSSFESGSSKLGSSESKKYLEQLSQKRAIQKILVNMMFSPIISNVLLYNRTHDYFYYTGIYFSDTDYIHEILSKNQVDEVFLNQLNETLYMPPHSNPWFSNSSQKIVLSVMKNFSDALTTQDTIVEIQVPYQVLADICSQTSFSLEKEFLILDENNKIVYPYQADEYILSEDTIKNIENKISEDILFEYHKDYAFYAVKSASTNFTTVLISNNKTIRKQNISYIITAVFAVFIALSAALTIIFLILSFITKPLKQLILHINTLKDGKDAILCLPNNSLDEFEVINQSFNQMLEQLKKSIAQNYELKIRESNANLAALQAQINPHFLYNTLNSISAASEIYGSDVTTKMCQDFSSMMHYITSKEQIVPLIHEINHAKNYLELMKISNDGNLDYSIEIAPELYTLKIPKLIIQPLVENCFKHAFCDCVPPWYIRILCSCHKEQFTIIIEDNGLGFSADALDKLSSFEDDIREQNFSYQDISINGLGLCNTFARMYAHFSGRFTFTIENLSPGCQIIMKGEL